MTIKIKVNGQEQELDVPDDMPLFGCCATSWA